MKKISSLIASVLLFAGVSFEEAPTKNIVETALAAPQFSTLVTLVKEAGLVEALSADGPFTLFAPTNSAFGKLPASTIAALKSDKEKLAKVLKYHLVSGSVPASKVVTLSSANTLEGSSVAIDSSGKRVKVNNSSVTKTDIMTSNGIIHVIDTVLIPQS